MASRLTILVLSFFIFSGSTCTVTVEPSTGTPVVQSIRVETPDFDQVKYIQTNNEDPDRDSDHSQKEYALDANSRLLLRYSDLYKNRSDIRLASGSRFEVHVRINEPAEADTVRLNVQLCGVERDWTLLATWLAADPFGGQGFWTRAGGDFGSAVCRTAYSVDAKHELVFDMSPWFNTHVRHADQDNGLILVTGVPIKVGGDGDEAVRPSIRYESSQL